MQLIFKEHQIKLSEPDKLIHSMSELIGDQYIYNYMKVDGTVVYDDPIEFFKNNQEALSDIEQIEIIALTGKEHVEGIAIEGSQYISNALPVLEEMSKSIYKDGIGSVKNKFISLSEGIQWLVSSLAVINEITTNSRENELTAKLQSALIELNEGLENNDAVLVADIIEYEVVEIFQEIQKFFEEV
ncbi:hypothetical protein [Jeotgalibacillus terrae]|uniref:DUF8042 domain-containing protein n=1 Tax=Jeotgalibacillus terrae TaxID=587735 RepID=A0ABW5ZER5_9BACL|nr:hypothetical protein [Jeotgalibacillus terrae]MBM7580167.1 hypothetical protein [Jeotgalibacillus terrae]